MHCRKFEEKSAILIIIKYAVLTAICLISCLDFEFESEYEDINGIYLEHVAAYDIYGQKVIIDNNLGYIANDDTLLIYNIEDVDSISLLTTYNAASTIRDFTIKGYYAYIAGIFGLEIIDLNGSSPTQIGMLTIPSYPQKIRVLDDRAYLTSGYYGNRFDIVDITDKTSPVFLDSISFDNEITHMEVDSCFAYILLYNDDFHIMDLRQPGSPSYVYSLLDTDTTLATSFALDGNYLHFSCRNLEVEKLVTYRFSDDELEQTSEIKCPVQFRRLIIDGSYGLGLPAWSDIYLFELIDHARPHIAEYIESEGDILNGTLDNNYIYLLSPLRIIEIKEVE